MFWLNVNFVADAVGVKAAHVSSRFQVMRGLGFALGRGQGSCFGLLGEYNQRETSIASISGHK